MYLRLLFVVLMTIDDIHIGLSAWFHITVYNIMYVVINRCRKLRCPGWDIAAYL